MLPNGQNIGPAVNRSTDNLCTSSGPGSGETGSGMLELTYTGS